MAKKKKVRVQLRKNRAKPPRENDFTRTFREDAAAAGDVRSDERVRAKGDLSRHRTVTQDDTAPVPGDPTAAPGMPAADPEGRVAGRVLRVHGLNSYVEAADGRVFRCAIRRLLKTLATDERSVVTTGDLVWLRPALSGSERGRGGDRETGRGGEEETRREGQATVESFPVPVSSSPPLPVSSSPLLPLSPSPPLALPEGLIERVEPRRGVLTRSSRRREHVLVANVDQLAIIVSLVEPDLKPHLIDRYVAAAVKGGLAPVLCLNKIDLADPVALQPMVGAYARLGVPVVLTSARTGAGVGRLRELLRGRATVFSGQSGVGKSSLLNAVEPGLGRIVREVSEHSQKGRHTTTTSELIRLETGGWVVDTPGVRQWQLWGTRAEEVEGYFRDFRPFVPLCGFPDCTHTHEARCAVKAAVARGQVSDRRYHSYLGLFHGVGEE